MTEQQFIRLTKVQRKRFGKSPQRRRFKSMNNDKIKAKHVPRIKVPKDKIRRCLPRGDCPGMMFWCNHCQRFHYHGIGEGGRTPHCDDFDAPDYWLKMHTVEQLKMIRAGIDRYLSLSPAERHGWKTGAEK